jgi:hypothetical protein
VADARGTIVGTLSSSVVVRKTTPDALSFTVDVRMTTVDARRFKVDAQNTAVDVPSINLNPHNLSKCNGYALKRAICPESGVCRLRLGWGSRFCLTGPLKLLAQLVS